MLSPLVKMSQEQAISYGDVFPGVQGELAKAAVAPGDAALMQSAESIATGQTLKGGPAATMQSAAARNELSGHVGHGQVGRVIAEKGVGVVEKGVPGHRTFTETIGHQVRVPGISVVLFYYPVCVRVYRCLWLGA